MLTLAENVEVVCGPSLREAFSSHSDWSIIVLVVSPQESGHPESTKDHLITAADSVPPALLPVVPFSVDAWLVFLRHQP